MTQEEADKLDQQVVRAFKIVIGREGNRTAAQQIVWKSFERTSREPNYTPGRGFDPIGAALNEGGRMYAVNLMAMVNQPEPKPKPKPKQ